MKRTNTRNGPSFRKLLEELRRQIASLFSVTKSLQNQINEGGGVAGVSSVNTRTGAITLASADVGLGNADNTSDSAKPISTATQTALDNKVGESDDNVFTGTNTFRQGINLETSGGAARGNIGLRSIEYITGANLTYGFEYQSPVSPNNAFGYDVAITDGSNGTLTFVQSWVNDITDDSNNFRVSNTVFSYKDNDVIHEGNIFSYLNERVIPAITGDVTLATAHLGRYIPCNNGSPMTITLDEITPEVPLGTKVTFVARTTEVVSFVEGTASINSFVDNLSIMGQNAGVTLIYQGSDTWDLIGGLS